MAANREEFYDRPTQPPAIQSGKPRVLCGVDQRAGGTWLGVNQHGLVVASSNRTKSNPPPAPRSRGTLCRELLAAFSAREATDLALEQLGEGQYGGVNYLCADDEGGWVVHGGDMLHAVELPPGLNLIANGDLNDPNDARLVMARRLLTLQQLDSAVKFLAIASKVFARRPSPPGRASIVIRQADRGTVSSTLISLGQKPRDAIYQYAPGPPDRTKFEDYSPMLRDILSRGLREAEAQA